jgi:Mycothiol maleylpyruvate isomerase N-terminal domain
MHPDYHSRGEPMTPITTAYLDAADCTARVLADGHVAASWAAPSALADMTVGAVAGHLARQIFNVQVALASADRAGEPISLLDHYARVKWIDAGHDDEANVSVRLSSEHEAADGPGPLADRAAKAARRLRADLPGEPADRPVFLPWGPWSLTLSDLLTTRLMEIAVHHDDLACSVGGPIEDLPAEATDVAVALLARLAVRRHGPAAVLRALSRAERAPASIAAF